MMENHKIEGFWATIVRNLRKRKYSKKRPTKRILGPF